MKQIAIIGGGPGGLMAAERLSAQPGRVVTLYDAMPSVGRKFLQAGRGGLNITHSKPLDEFICAYGERQTEIEPWIRAFPPQAVRDWVESFGIQTFVGSSGRVYPEDMKAAPLLRAWLKRLRAQGVQFAMRHRWTGWSDTGALRFQTPSSVVQCQADITLLALGGASWPHLGSTGEWTQAFEPSHLAPFLAANGGFEINWSAIFQAKCAGQPLKSVALKITDKHNQAWLQKGELLITKQGVEGSLIYQASRLIRDSLIADGKVDAELDLLPDVSHSRLEQKLAKPQGKLSLSNVFKRAGIDSLRLNLLREQLDNNALKEPARVAARLKAYPLAITQARPLSEAISSAGGLRFESLNKTSEIITRPGCYAIGEMLDWEAPTGGYLLTAVLAQARYVAQQIIAQQEIH
ncbi:TIGR03862 family flavoprotein [Thiomicrospira microaerophila]|uniref:TIGR03862 family flavoprotein n=1 Tax=Thiomicrospira microaerophila TaxID=406020 RepID=UPI0005CAEA0E|nr:TIGR03862 family flavoprotein [Thiomicrospira microaerophila]